MDTPINLETDDIRPINVFVKARFGKCNSPATNWRWRLKGVNGAKLTCVRFGGCWCTTAAAFADFIREQTANCSPAPLDTDAPAEPEWTHRRFAQEFVMTDPQTRDAILAKAFDAGLATRRAEQLFKLAEGAGLIHSWPSVVRNKRGFANVPPPITHEKNTHTSPLVPPNTKPQKRRVGVGENGVCEKRKPIAFGNRDR